MGNLFIYLFFAHLFFFFLDCEAILANHKDATNLYSVMTNILATSTYVILSVNWSRVNL